ncbi:MAG: hypothetical protein M1832_001326 [Thelocarpon impressellum]|nr:MAG: hypothetical protein M1832_001326 [Thelocarpon impressellum]
MASSERPRNPSASSSLLAPLARRDDDSGSIRSVSEQDSDTDDDQVLEGAQNSLEIAEHDRSVLEQEEEREKLLVAGESPTGLGRIFSGGFSNGSRVKVGKRQRRKEKRREKRRSKRERSRGDGEDGALMYEMEEGGLRSDDSSVSSDASSDLDRRKLDTVFERRSRPSRCCTLSVIFVSILVLFIILLLGAYQASRRAPLRHVATSLSNGTSAFAPTTILVSLDGFRADFLNRNLTPTLNSFIAEGISPRYMLPSFPSVTFPNHFTLVTGLYPESHGVVGNTFWDPELQEEFYYTDPARSMQPKWWAGEPLWVTAELQGVRSAIHMWPGSEAHIGGIEPSYMDKYNGSEVLSKKVDRVLELLDMPGPGEVGVRSGFERPQFIAAYVPVVDSDGHKYGPNSTEIRATIERVDVMLRDLFAGLRERNLTDVVNVVVVSDHGMATTSTDRLIQLEHLIDTSLIEHIDGWPLYGLRPKKLDDLQGMYENLSAQAATNPSFDVYLRDENMPERYHFSHNPRIAPLWIVPRAGWAIVKKDEFDVEKAKANGEVYHPRGLHGYDHEHPLMRAIFVARGPAFPHTPNSRLEVFQNTEVYNILADSLSLEPHPNNGTLRLPLRPVGLHSDDGAPALATPSDPEAEVEKTPVGVDEPDVPSGSRPTIDDSGNDGEEKSRLKTLMDFLGSKFEGFKEWVEAKMGGGPKEDDSEGDGQPEGDAGPRR